VTEQGFASVVLDVDSTLCGIEGIDWLAKRRGAELGASVAALTDRAMRGELPLDSLYGERLALVQPTRDEIDALGAAYVEALAPGAARAVHRLRETKRRVVLVSGGIREAILPVAATLGLSAEDVRAVSLRFAADGSYTGFEDSPLTTDTGKRTIVEAMRLPRPILAVGDGNTDLAMRPAVDLFAAFVLFIRREPVVAGADRTLDSFDHLLELALA
jgi:phosphoserine phosphatase